MSREFHPFEENYYALLLAIIYPSFLNADEAIYAIRNGVNPIAINKETLLEGLNLSELKTIPRYLDERYGRRYEIIKFIAEFIKVTNEVMQSTRDYELERYRENVIHYMNYFKERMEKEKIR